MSVPQTVATWTVLETIVSVLGLAGVMLLGTGGRLVAMLSHDENLWFLRDLRVFATIVMSRTGDRGSAYMLIVDAHLDLAMNAIEWNRDLSRPHRRDPRRASNAQTDRPDRGKGTVSFAEMRRGGVGLCVATQIARYSTLDHPFPGWHSPEQAWAMTQAQLAWYRSMEERGELVQVRDAADARSASGQPANESWDGPIGYVLSLEGADSLVTIGHLERAYAQGLRAVGPGHYGPGVYAQGTNAEGDLGARGRELVREMERLGMILDATHLCDESFRDALDHFHGPRLGEPLELPRRSFRTTASSTTIRSASSSSVGR